MKKKVNYNRGLHFLKNVGLLSVILFMNGCSKDLAGDQPEEVLAISVPIEWNAGATNLRTEITNGTFAATPAILNCWGENIRISGTVENKINTTTDGNGVVHYTRHWIITGLNTVGLGNTITGLAAGTTYKIIAGVEMFTVTNPVFVNPTPPGNTVSFPSPTASGNVFIHQGTIVLEVTSGVRIGERLVIRHVIKKHPQTGLVTNNWYCMGK